MNNIGNLLLVAAVVAGFIRYKALTRFLKVFVWALLAGLLTIAASEAISKVLRWPNNSIAVNLFIICETSLLLYAASLVWSSARSGLILIFCGCLVAAIWGVECFMHSIFSLNHYSLLAEHVCMLILYVLMMYRIVSETRGSARDAGFWVSVGVVINAGGNIPFFCLYYYLLRYDKALATRLYQIISIVASIQYLCCIVAFIIHRPAVRATTNKRFNGG